MLDIVPPQHDGQPRRSPRPAPEPDQAQSVPVGPRTVELSWQLPSRLRRPIREELQRQRHKKRQRTAIANFSKRPLPETVPTKPTPVRTSAPSVNQGVEHHTGDVYQQQQPGLRLPAPPYRGRFVSGKAAPPTASVPVANQRPAQAQSVRRAEKPRRRIAQQAPTRRSRRQSALFGERDVPFAIAQSDQAPPAPLPETKTRVNEPRRRFALPLHVSIWPFSRGADKGEADTSAASKKKRRARLT